MCVQNFMAGGVREEGCWASAAAMVIAVLLVFLCVSFVFLCGVQLLHLSDSPFFYVPTLG